MTLSHAIKQFTWKLFFLSYFCSYKQLQTANMKKLDTKLMHPRDQIILIIDKIYWVLQWSGNTLPRRDYKEKYLQIKNWLRIERMNTNFIR